MLAAAEDKRGAGSNRRRMRKLPPNHGQRRKAKPQESIFTTEEITGNALDYLAKYCILPEKLISRYDKVFQQLDTDNDGIINRSELAFGLRTVNNNMISKGELK